MMICCSKCSATGESNFSPSAIRKHENGDSVWCRACLSAAQRSWRARNPERAAENSRRWTRTRGPRKKTRDQQITAALRCGLNPGKVLEALEGLA